MEIDEFIEHDLLAGHAGIQQPEHLMAAESDEEDIGATSQAHPCEFERDFDVAQHTSPVVPYDRQRDVFVTTQRAYQGKRPDVFGVAIAQPRPAPVTFAI
ncbi:MAG: hypothetical protein WCJ67_12395, partial [Thermoleophilia bacterium]